MDNFRTIVSPTPAPFKMGVSDPIFTIGSCFADTIGSKLHNHKLPSLANPFGTIYNPHSIHKVLLYSLTGEFLSSDTFVENQGICLNFDFHSSVSSLDQALLKNSIGGLLTQSRAHLLKARWILITYGTASVYSRNENGEIVANCHKLPGSLFSKSMMTTEAIVDSFDRFYGALRELNPAVHIILTVSPVRHIKDTLEVNSVSKSILRTACDIIQTRHDNVMYFPAFEIMMDDLRDYRFYKSDLIHPSDVAEEYIWNAFGRTYFDPDLRNFILQWKEIRQALAHRPFHPNTRGHLKFLNDTLKKLGQLSKQVNVDSEVSDLRGQILEIEANLKTT